MSDPKELNDFVQKLADDINSKLNRDVTKLPEVQRWLVKSRVLNMLFGSHYGVILKTVEENVEQREALLYSDLSNQRAN